MHLCIIDFSLLIEPCWSHLADQPQSAWTIWASLVSNRLILLGLRIGHLELQAAEACSGSALGAEAHETAAVAVGSTTRERDWRASLRPQKQWCLKFFSAIRQDKIWSYKKANKGHVCSFFFLARVSSLAFPSPNVSLSLSLTSAPPSKVRGIKITF